MSVTVHYNGDCTTSFYLENITTEKYADFDEGTSNVPGPSSSSADYILEQKQCGSYPDFGTESFSNGYFVAHTNSEDIDGGFDWYGYTQQLMYDCNVPPNQVANNSDPSAGAFDVTYFVS